MSNEQSSLDYYITKLTEILGPEIIKQISRDDNERIARLEKRTKAMHKEEIEEKLNVAYGNGYEQGEMDFYKKMQVKGDKYAEGYSEGYKRALELVKWKIINDLQGGNNEQQ